MSANVRLSWKENGLPLTPYIDPDLLIYPGCKPRVSIRPQELPAVLPSSYGRLNLCRFLESVKSGVKNEPFFPDPASYPPEPYPPTDPVELKIQSILETSYECTRYF